MTGVLLLSDDKLLNNLKIIIQKIVETTKCFMTVYKHEVTLLSVIISH